MKAIKIFVSSPSDVKLERKICEKVICTVASELQLLVDVSYSRHLLNDNPTDKSSENDAETETEEALVLCPYFWEYQRFQNDGGYQEQIPRTDTFDLVVSILWSRLGTHLRTDLLAPDGTAAKSGTAYEILWARHARTLARQNNPELVFSKLKPELNVYRNTSPISLKSDDRRFDEKVEQRRQLEEFLQSLEKAPDGTYHGATIKYQTLKQFEKQFERDIRDFLSQFLPEKAFQRIIYENLPWNPKSMGSPFRRLDVYEAGHEFIYRGRTKATENALRAIQSQFENGTPFVLILGASGAGKSSLARAGILPFLLKSDSIGDIEVWKHAIFRPGESQKSINPCHALAEALVSETAFPVLLESHSNDPLTELSDSITRDPKSITLRLLDHLGHFSRDTLNTRRALVESRIHEYAEQGRVEDEANERSLLDSLLPPKSGLVILIDQAEELFHGNKDQESIEAFVAAIEHLVKSQRILVVLTLRSDFYHHYQSHSNWVDLAGENGKIDLLPPDSEEIFQIIRDPASASGLRYEKNEEGRYLHEEILERARDNPNSLPLLSHLLDLLYQEQITRGDGWLRWDDYKNLGEFDGALTNHAETIFTGTRTVRLEDGTEEIRPYLTDVERKAFPHLLSGLVNLGASETGGSTVLRRYSKLADLTHDADDCPIDGIERLVDVLSSESARLLTVFTDPVKRDRYVTISHEVLLRHWDRVKEWVEQNSDAITRRQSLDLMVEQYEEAKAADESSGTSSASDYLLSHGQPLENGIRLLAESRPVLLASTIRYIRSSIAREFAARLESNLESPTSNPEAMSVAPAEDDGWNDFLRFSDRIRSHFPELWSECIHGSFSSSSTRSRENLAKLLSLQETNDFEEDLVAMALSDQDEKVRRAAAHSLITRGRISGFERVKDPSSFSDRPELQSERNATLANLLSISEMQSSRNPFSDWYPTLPAWLRRAVRLRSWAIRFRRALPVFLFVLIPAVIMSILGAAVAKWVPSAFNYSCVQETGNWFIGLFHGGIAAVFLGGGVVFGLTLYRLVFGKEHEKVTVIRPIPAVLFGAISGFLSGIFLVLMISQVYSPGTLGTMGWSPYLDTKSEDHAPSAEAQSSIPADTLVYHLFFVSRCGWAFPLTSLGLGIALALMTNSLRSSDDWKEFLLRQKRIRSVSQVGSLIREIIRVTLPHAIGIPILVGLFAVLSLFAMSFGDGASADTDVGIREIFLGGVKMIENDPDLENVPDLEQINLWKRSFYGRALGLFGDGFGKIVGGYFAAVGMALGIVMMREGVEIKPHSIQG